MARPRILVTNDDGIHAPGLRALVAALVAADFADIYVCAPSGERSAQSHAITLGRYMTAVPTEIPGVKAAHAVDGTPADSVMLALHSPIFQDPNFDLVLSGINRGDNAGLHVIYSGTVGAAREAACKGTPSIALSLDNHRARTVEDYNLSAKLSVPLAQAMLGLCKSQDSAAARPAAELAGTVLNVNFPLAQGLMLAGLYLTAQSLACVFPEFKEITEQAGPHLAEIEEHTPNSRVFRNYAGAAQSDELEGNDEWALKNGWVSVTPLSLRSDVPGRLAADALDDARLTATGAVLTAAAAELDLAVGGLSRLQQIPVNGKL